MDVGIASTKPSHFECVNGQSVVEMENYILYAQSGKGEQMSWEIAETASEIEKIKSESADYLNGLNSCGIID